MYQVLHACHFQPRRNDVGASLVVPLVKNLPAMHRVRFLDWEDLLEQEMATHLEFLPGESCGQRSLAGYSQWHHKSWTRQSD